MLVGLLMVGGGVGRRASFGSLLGLGGGILIVPLLTLGFGLPLREAVGVSLVCVIVTSSAAAGVYLERHVANLRLGMTLELFTAIGALVGGSIAFLLDERSSSFLFAVLLVYVAFTMARAALGRARPSRGPTDVAASASSHGRTRRSGAAPTGARRSLDASLSGPATASATRVGIVGATVRRRRLGPARHRRRDRSRCR